MSNTSDDNSTNESLASSSTSSRSNPIKASMLRPSTLMAGANATSSSSSPAAASSLPKNFLRPASFQVDSSSTAVSATSSDTPTKTDATGGEPNTATAGAPSSSSASSSSPPATSTAGGGDGDGTPASSSGTGNNLFLISNSHNAADVDTSCSNSEVGSSSAAVAASSKNGIEAAKPTNGLPKTTANLFKTANPTIPTTTSTGPADFVFGQNVHERVTIESINNDGTSSSSTSSASSSQLFAIAASTSAAAAADKAAASAGTPTADPPTVESLSEVARAYEESRAQKRKYEEVETFTGEEDETNVMDVNCKLFAFVASNWEERGPGNLRVNDNKDRSKSPRVVFRTSGNLRVLLNTTIWPGMVVERPSQKSLRFSAIDADGQIKIFLAMARPDDISILVNQLNKRINFEKSRPHPVSVARTSSSSSSKSDEVTSSASAAAGCKVAKNAREYLDPAVVDIQTEGERDAANSSDEEQSNSSGSVAKEAAAAGEKTTEPEPSTTTTD